MNVFSLRALFKKASCMFCASLSIVSFLLFASLQVPRALVSNRDRIHEKSMPLAGSAATIGGRQSWEANRQIRGEQASSTGSPNNSIVTALAGSSQSLSGRLSSAARQAILSRQKAPVESGL